MTTATATPIAAPTTVSTPALMTRSLSFGDTSPSLFPLTASAESPTSWRHGRGRVVPGIEAPMSDYWRVPSKAYDQVDSLFFWTLPIPLLLSAPAGLALDFTTAGLLTRRYRSPLPQRLALLRKYLTQQRGGGRREDKGSLAEGLLLRSS